MSSDLPSTQMEFEERFSTEAACIQYLRRQRWPEGFHCPKCSGKRAWELRRRALDQCASCNHQVSLTAGTVFHGTRKPLRLWFRVIGQLVLSKSGCSALDISRQHGLKYETAWTWLHKLRNCMGQFGRALLEGDVEVDETYLGGEDDEAHKGRSLSGHKTPVAAAVEWRGEAIGRIRLIAVVNATALSLCGFVQQNVAPGSHVKTDGLQSYASLSELGFRHESIVLGKNPKSAIKHLPNVHRVFHSCAAGCSAPTRAPPTRFISSPISTSLSSASTAAAPPTAGSFSSASSSGLFHVRRPTRPSRVGHRYPW